MIAVRRITHPRYSHAFTVLDPTRREKSGRAKRITYYFKSEEEAATKLRELGKTILAVGVQGVELSPAARADYAAARALLDVDFPRVSLADVARAWLNTQGAGPANRTKVGPLLERFLDEKAHAEGATERTRNNLEQRVEAWCEREKIETLGDITRETCLALRDRRGVEAATRKNDMNAVSSFLSWLVQERQIPFNPLMGQRRPKVVRNPPEIYTAEQMALLLRAAAGYKAGRFARFVGLLFLAGLRPSEAPHARLDLDHEKPAVRVQGGKLRGRANRITHLSPAAAEWMRRRPAAVVEMTTGQRNQLCKLAGVDWIQDGARHTWISAKLALTNDEKLVAREAGTSPDTIFKHYHRLMPKSEAEAFERVVAGINEGKKSQRKRVVGGTTQG